MRITVLTTRLFDRPRSGGEACTARLLDALSDQGHELRLFGRGPLPPQAGPGSASLGPLVQPFDGLPWPRRIGCAALAVASSQALTVRRLQAGDVARRLREHLQADRAPRCDALIVDHLQALAWLPSAGPGLPAPLLVLHNLESDGYQALARSAAPGPRRWMLDHEARQLQRLEQQALRISAAVACLSAEDAHVVRRRLPLGPQSRPVGVLPGYPAAALQPPGASGPGPGAAPGGSLRIGLIGTWSWPPNRLALQWMIDAVAPRLPARCRLVLAGSGLEPLRRRHAPQPGASIEWLGPVDDVHSFYRQVDAVAIPSLLGTGVQEKTIEALALAPAVIATPHALRGLAPPWPAHVQVAADPEAFARACALPVPAAAAPLRQRQLAAWRQAQAQRYQATLTRLLQASAATAMQPGAAWPGLPPARPVA